MDFNKNELKIIKQSLDFYLCECSGEDLNDNISISNKIEEHLSDKPKKKLRYKDIENIVDSIFKN